MLDREVYVKETRKGVKIFLDDSINMFHGELEFSIREAAGIFHALQAIFKDPFYSRHEANQYKITREENPGVVKHIVLEGGEHAE